LPVIRIKISDAIKLGRYCQLSLRGGSDASQGYLDLRAVPICGEGDARRYLPALPSGLAIHGQTLATAEEE
jgi:hypothetical protein